MPRKIITRFEQPYPDEYFPKPGKDDFKTELPYQINQEYIPLDAREFYKDFGYIRHPQTNEQVTELAPYQYDVWDNKAKTKLIVKPQKSGMTTSILMEDFQIAVSKRGRGKDILLVAQTAEHAIEHLYTLKRLIVDSPKYQKYLITKSVELYFKEEQTKVGVLFIKNPDNAYRPTRIIARGFSHQQLWSWKNICHIHMSDVVAAEIVDDESVYAAAKSRLANTNGTWIIESPPRGTNNYYYRMYEMYKDNTDPDVYVKVIHIDDAIKYKITTKEFIESERKRLGYLWFQFYGSQFLEGGGNFFSVESIDRAVELGSQYDPDNYRPTSEKYICCDLGFSTSLFVILVLEWNREHRQIRILHAEDHLSPLVENIQNRILELRKRYGNVLNIGIDATSKSEFCMSLKTRIGEFSYWPRIKKMMDECKQRNIPIEKRMVIVPVIFSTESKLMMSQHLKEILDKSHGFIAISPKFDKLINSLKGAVFDERGLLDKQASPNPDYLDALMIGCTFFRFTTKEENSNFNILSL